MMNAIRFSVARPDQTRKYTYILQIPNISNPVLGSIVTGDGQWGGLRFPQYGRDDRGMGFLCRLFGRDDPARMGLG